MSLTGNYWCFCDILMAFFDLRECMVSSFFYYKIVRVTMTGQLTVIIKLSYIHTGIYIKLSTIHTGIIPI